MAVVASLRTDGQEPITKTVSGFLVAAGRAAALASQLEDDENDIEKEQEVDDAHIETRLNAVLEVNRALHSALRRRQDELAQVTKLREHLRLRLSGRELEDPYRSSRVTDLQAELSDNKTTSRTSRQADELGKRVAKLERKIEDLNQENLKLSEVHRSDRTQLQEHQSRLRTLGRRERELAKQLDVMSQKLNTTVAEAIAQGDDRPVIDFRNLPGLRLDKLIDGLRLQPPVASSLSPQAAGDSSGPDSPGKSPKDGVAEERRTGGVVRFLSSSQRSLPPVDLKPDAAPDSG
eukprot:TRINITY_DN35645_c0_g1_i1.p1 TRINITY_DN35645_c0_g1~~TRINITY_DN35645_c0_g1_i1.p1  ORF type:complete len:309 (+),score=46.73 TRINITY_DN35645_c0_g1_i1:55-927(+)